MGKEERRWLSHYEPLQRLESMPESISPPVASAAAAESTPPTTTTMDHKPTLKEVLDRTLWQADQVLQAAAKDQRSIAQVIKMADADSVLGDDDEDGSLERLRWYVYPKECALRLKQHGLKEVTTEDEQVLGAINPFLTVTTVVAGITNTTKTMHEGEQPTKAGGSNAVADRTKEKKRKTCIGHMDSDGLDQFRDIGSHQEEAGLNEIDERTAPHEHSSSQSEVLNRGAGESEYVKALQPAAKKQRDLDIEQQSELLSNTSISHTKKAPRDRSMWGKGEVTGLLTSISMAETKAHSTEGQLPLEPVNGSNNSSTIKNSAGNGKKRTRHVKPPPKLMRLVIQAVFQWDMIQEGDRLLLGLSGGKDSLSLLHCLLELQRKLPTSFEIEVCTIDPMTPSFDPSPLIPYVEQTLGLKYHYVRDDIVARATSAGKDGSMVSSLCAFCARMKRGNLYNVARQNQCNKLVLAQHLDDCAESFLMSVMHNGFLRTMKASYEINAGDLSVIRPMVYCRESLMTEFAKNANLPVINENCPACFEEPKERARIKKLLSREELNYPNFYDNIKRSLLPLMHPLSEAVMHSFTEEAVAKSRSKWTPISSKNKRSKTMNDVESSSETPNVAATTVDGAQGVNTTNTIVVPSNSVDTATGPTPSGTNDTTGTNDVLSAFSDEQLMAVLARRKAARFRLAGAMKSLNNKNDGNNNDMETNNDNGHRQQHSLEEAAAAVGSFSGQTLCDVGGACSLFD